MLLLALLAVLPARANPALAHGDQFRDPRPGDEIPPWLREPVDPDVCGDCDGDTCDDCVIGIDGFGPLADASPLNDGDDYDGDGIGAACVLYSLLFDFNLSAFIIEAVWLLISLLGLVRILHERPRPAA